jgi:hypothetical protein
MKAANMSMAARARRRRASLNFGLTLLAAGLTALSVGTAQAQASSRAGPSPKVVSRVHQPAGTPQKASSFAPHPTKRRVFGAPIQPPIVRNVPPKKKNAPAARTESRAHGAKPKAGP